MSVKLGPMPKHLRDLVQHWIAEALAGGPGTVHPTTGGLLISGWLRVGCTLTPDGTIWQSMLIDFITRLEDGPEKVATIVWAAREFPTLADWLPRRPVEATLCPGEVEGQPCDAGRSSRSVGAASLYCLRCGGLGWVLPDGAQPGP